MHERLKQLRKELHLTQQQFADKISVKRNTVALLRTLTPTEKKETSIV